MKIYFQMWLMSFKGLMMYRIDFMVGMISQFLTQIIDLIFIWIVFQNVDTLQGWNSDQILFLYGLMMLSIGISEFLFDELYDLGRFYMREGNFDGIILRPIHPLISIIGATKNSAALGYFILGIGLVVAMLVKLQIPITLLLIGKIVVFSIIGGLIVGAVMVIASTASFWTYRSNDVIWSFWRMYTMTQYPISIYNTFIQVLITFILPFAFVAYFPALHYLGMEGQNMIWICPIAMLAIWFGAIRVWNFGLNKYKSTGT